MTDDSLDRMIRQALLAAAEADCQQVMAQTTEEPPPSPAYQRWTRRFLKNPLAELRRTRRPVWKRILRTAACFLLMLSISFGAIMAVSPTARARVTQWFVTQYKDHTSYTFENTKPMDIKLQNWAPAYLPDGFEYTETISLPGYTIVLYNNGDPEMEIEFDYQRMQEGGGFGLDNERNVVSNVMIHGSPGQLFTATDDRQNMLLWMDEKTQYAFLLISRVDCDSLIKIAESVSLVK